MDDDLTADTLLLLNEAISLGRRDGMAGQHLGAMCSARDEIERLHAALGNPRIRKKMSYAEFTKSAATIRERIGFEANVVQYIEDSLKAHSRMVRWFPRLFRPGIEHDVRTRIVPMITMILFNHLIVGNPDYIVSSLERDSDAV